MARRSDQKRKLLLLLRILEEQSDEEHPIPLARLIGKLEEEGISAERKSLYDDMETLRLHGVDVVNDKRRGYYIGRREFQLAELKLLVDAVQSSRFITEKKSRELIGKLERLTSVHEARQLQRQVYVSGRVKAMNESIYYNIDRLHAGIAAGKQLSFLYFDYGVNKERVYRRAGARYTVSPYALIWDNENYYLVAYAADTGDIRHYRVDKMRDIQPTDQPRLGGEAFAAFDLGQYSARHFGMYGGRTERVTLRCQNRLVGVVLDRFGRDVMLAPDGEEHFTVTVQVAVSPQFFGWVFGLTGGVRITSPAPVAAEMAAQLREVAGQYDVELCSFFEKKEPKKL